MDCQEEKISLLHSCLLTAWGYLLTFDTALKTG
jgi:hypothetical protein